ncbi:MAG TPA: hypothetical protein VF621_14840, partial [Pyrinomonadaceae bacterium]
MGGAWAIIRGNRGKIKTASARAGPGSPSPRAARRIQGGSREVKAELHIVDMRGDSCAALIKDTLEDT